jgi:1,2-diacylglycerol 3-beta-glucosyltransferase
MIVNILSIFVVVYAFIYIFFTLVLAYGERRIKPNTLPDELPFVSVIICARNEEPIIRRCLDNMMKLDYPREKLEILIVDDESEDKTLDIFLEYASKDSVFKVLSSAGEPRDLPAKQRPLNLGINKSGGEILLLTDADIEVQPGWIKGHLTAYNEKIGIVGGTTRIDVSSGKIFDNLQNSDLTSKHAVAMGCAGLGFPLTIMGNNISFRRDAYETVGGLKGINRSIVEDMALMNAIIKRTKYTLAWIADSRGVVTSLPEKNFDTFIHQRLRWVHEVTDLSFIGKFMITMESLMVVSFFISIGLFYWSKTAFAVNAAAWVIGYIIMLFPTPGRRINEFIYIPGMLIFQISYSIVAGWRKIFGEKKILWKGRFYG